MSETQGALEAPVPLDKLNQRAGKLSRVAFEGTVPFGARTITCFRLGNGLRVLCLEDHRAPVVSVHTWFRVGSRDEQQGKTGLAHLFEHLMFNETENLPAGQFDRILEHAGAQTNAATWNDWTYYYEDVPADGLAVVLELESERMANLKLTQKQVRSEKEVVANERRYRVDDDVDGAMNELLYKTAFTVHPYHHPTIGWMTDIQNFTTKDCRDFYRSWYAPNNATLVVVGDFATSELLKLVQKHYGALKPVPQHKGVRRVEPEQTSERRVTERKPTSVAKLAIGYRGPALGHADHAPLSILLEALFGGRSARFFRRLVTEKELALDLSGSVSNFIDPGLIEFELTAREGISAEKLLEALDACVQELAEKPVTQDERDRAVARTELGYLQSLETVGGRADQIGFYDTVLGDPAGGLRRLDELRAVELPALQRVAKEYLQVQRRTVILVEPDGQTAEQSS